MRRTVSVLLMALGLGGTAAGDGINPQAPPETEQFAFLLGEWSCKTRFARPDGTYAEDRATWTGSTILDGWAIQDVWTSRRPDGAEFHGVNLRSFNPRTAKWDNRWLPQGSLEWKYYEAEKVGDTMVMTGGEGSDARGAFVDRNTFHDITSESWKWRKDRSYDGGKTWIEGVGFIEATRWDLARPPLLERVEHGYAEGDGVKLHYAALGEGPLMVLLHGFPDYWYTWRHQMEHLAENHRVVAVDLRGYNRSDQPAGVDSYAMRRLIGDVAAVVRHFGEERAVLVGHDWGGAIAWQVATYRPEIVDRLIILSTPHPQNLMRELSRNPEQRSNSDYARRFQEEGAHEELTAEGLASWVEDDSARALYVEAFRRSSFEGMLSYYKANYPRGGSTGAGSAPPAPPLPGKIRCPVLAIHGLEDKALMPQGFDGTWQWVDAEVTLVSIPGAGHFIQHEAADQVTRAMLSWLGR